jgi:hypothetical protein
MFNVQRSRFSVHKAGRRREGSLVVWRGAWWLSATLLAGCESGKLSGDFSRYVSPQVRGQVLAADTHQPLAGATVRRVSPNRTAAAATPPKGAQLLMASRGVQTDAEGRFFLDGERTIALINRGVWHSVTVSFTQAGYREYRTNYAATSSAEETPDGVPLVNAGEIILQPKHK